MKLIHTATNRATGLAKLFIGLISGSRPQPQGDRREDREGGTGIVQFALFQTGGCWGDVRFGAFFPDARIHNLQAGQATSMDSA